MNARMTSALAPALSPRRGRIVRRFFENLYDWIGRTLIRKTRNKRKLFPLLGERIKGEGGCHPCNRLCRDELGVTLSKIPKRIYAPIASSELQK
jgi:hypothetical protein